MLRDQVKPYIPQIVKREMTNRELARLLDASEGAICRVLKQLKVVREPAARCSANRALREERAKFRAQAATTLSIKEAAAAANCSTRTIYRIKAKYGAEKP